MQHNAPFLSIFALTCCCLLQRVTGLSRGLEKKKSDFAHIRHLHVANSWGEASLLRIHLGMIFELHLFQQPLVVVLHRYLSNMNSFMSPLSAN